VLADGEGQILNRKAVELLLRKAQNSRTLGDMGGLPKDWGSFSNNDFEKLVRNLDIYNTGSIDYKVLATCCILLQSTIGTDAEIEALKKSLGTVMSAEQASSREHSGLQEPKPPKTETTLIHSQDTNTSLISCSISTKAAARSICPSSPRY